ncbi:MULTISPECIES: tail fiber protein [Paenibacillus]|uniref:Tail fiber protein n=1 Tax=Paenibacillus cucumis (ex Kampfer et al. 2016) TaxID=1776858 RepID=A0ABS7KFP5_9BACL|nr:tail fiber protein [Paenibacillus cucumis (ex Kampfer et al. 2016)]MBY0202973.1 tail fiber protein [Paenibacillus cucumis (ex Kampfer et al. 2016)]
MPKETDRLKLPLPLGNETVTRESINGIFEKIDAGVATRESILISAGSDLNSYITEGEYYCPTNATVGTLANSPVGVAFHLTIEKHAGVVQTLTTFEPSNLQVFQRNYYVGWGPWKKVPTRDDIEEVKVYTDQKVGEVVIDDASLTNKGIVQLSNAVDGTRENRAATEKAVRDAATAAETNAKNASLPKSGGSLVGDAGVLNLVGSTHVYQSFLPAGVNAGRKGYIGFGTPGGIDLTIANEYGGELIFRDKNGPTTLSDLKSSVSSGKASIAAAITGKGIPTAADASFLMMSNNISSLRTSIKFKSATVSASGGSISSLSFKPLFLLVQSSSYREVGGMIGSVRSNGNILAWLDESNTLKRSTSVGASAGTSSPESSNFDFSYVEFGERSVNFGVQYYARSNQNSLECFVFGL